MTESFQLWELDVPDDIIEEAKREIDILEEYKGYCHGEKYLSLDMKKDKLNNIEYIVNKLSNYHIKKNNFKNCEIEFWVKNGTDTNGLHMDCDENIRENKKKYIHPSISCVYYLNDSICPFILTSIKEKDKIYQTYNNKNYILCFPKKNTSVTFEPDNFHGVLSNNENSDLRYIIAINIWENHIPNAKKMSETFEEYEIKKYNIQYKLIENYNNFIINKSMENMQNLYLNKKLFFSNYFFNLLLNKIKITINDFNKIKIFEHLLNNVNKQRKSHVLYISYVNENIIYNINYNTNHINYNETQIKNDLIYYINHNEKIKHKSKRIFYFKNDIDKPLLLINISKNDIMFKNYDEKNISLYFPKKNDILLLNDNYLIYYDYCKQDISNNIIIIEKEDINNIDNYKDICYNNITLNLIQSHNYDTNNRNINTYEFFNNVINNNELSAYNNDINKLIKNIKKQYKKPHFINIIYEKTNVNHYENEYNINHELVKDKLRLEQDIVNLHNDNYSKRINRFYQRKVVKKFIPNQLCKMLIDESEKYANTIGGWHKIRHQNNYTTDLEVKDIDSIKDIVNYLSNSVYDIAFQHYQIPKNIYNIDVNDIFMVKYEYKEGCQNCLEPHIDGSMLSFQILLNDDFEGGGTHFNDGIIYKPNTGDLCIHTGKVYHSGVPITQGTRYLLVCFFNFIKI